MKFKKFLEKIAAVALVCTMLAGQTVWAQEPVTETEGQDSQEEQAGQEAQVTREDAEYSGLEEADMKQENLSQDEMSEAESEVQQTEAAGEEEKDQIDPEAGTQEKNAEKSENLVLETAEYETDGNSEVEVIEETICVNYPIMIEPSVGPDEDYVVESQDEDICQVTYVICDYRLYFILTGICKGKTEVCVKLYDDVILQYDVTVNPLPEDAVMFNDLALRTELVSNNCNANGDGCVTKDELLNLTYLYIWFDNWNEVSPLKDLTGLEYAENLQHLDLDDNKELSDINVLFELESLETVSLQGTSVSDADRWRLADFKDYELAKGDDDSRFGTKFGGVSNLFGEDLHDESFRIECVSGSDCINLETRYGYNYWALTAKEAGTVRLKISYHDLSTEITLTVQGIPANQEVGDSYETTINPKSTYGDDGQLLIADDSGHLWKIYPEAEKLADNVKDYAVSWILYPDEEGSLGEGHGEYFYRNNAECYTYVLDKNNVLWNGSEKLAEDVVKFDVRYALDSKGVLTNIYNAGNEQIEDVADWGSASQEGINYFGDDSAVMLLKKDGTLWLREETAKDQKPGEFQLIDTDVQQIDPMILKKDGTVWVYMYEESGEICPYQWADMGQTVRELVVEEAGYYAGYNDIIRGYYDEEGNFYYYYSIYLGYNEETEKSEYDTGYVNLGKLNVEACGSKYILSQDGIDYSLNYILSQDGIVYSFDEETKKVDLLLENVIRANNYSAMDAYHWSDWGFQLSDGTYCDWEGKPMSEAVVKGLALNWYGSPYQLVWREDGSQVVEKNGIAILDHVADIYDNSWGESGQVFALRTDGTIWNVTGVPKQILDLKDTGVTTGDINGDGGINLLDLMQCLNHVSKKSELTGDAFIAADVNGDGKVDLIDLMRILNYVSKKTSEL